MKIQCYKMMEVEADELRLSDPYLLVISANEGNILFATSLVNQAHPNWAMHTERGSIGVYNVERLINNKQI